MTPARMKKCVLYSYFFHEIHLLNNGSIPRSGDTALTVQSADGTSNIWFKDLLYIIQGPAWCQVFYMHFPM